MQSVQTHLLPHIRGALDQIIRQCQSLTDCEKPSKMDIKEEIKPNENLSFITKMKRRKKKKKKDPKTESKWDVVKKSLEDEIIIEEEEEIIEDDSEEPPFSGKKRGQRIDF